MVRVHIDVLLLEMSKFNRCAVMSCGGSGHLHCSTDVLKCPTDIPVVRDLRTKHMSTQLLSHDKSLNFKTKTSAFVSVYILACVYVFWFHTLSLNKLYVCSRICCIILSFYNFAKTISYLNWDFLVSLFK